MKATFTDHLPSGKTVEYTSVPLPVWNTQGNPIASNQYVVDGTEIKRTGLHSDEGKLQDFIVNLMNVHFGGMVLDVPSECPIKKLYTSSDLKFLLDWYAAQLTKNSDEINALFIRVQELERKSFSSSDGYYYITPKDTSMISFVSGTNLVLSTIKNKFDVGGSDDDLVFTSKNPELFTVENGNLVKKGTGIGVLEASSKKNSSLKTTVKVLSIRPEDIGIEGVDGLQDGDIEGTTAPDTANLDTNTGGNFAQSVLTIATAKDHKNDADGIKKALTLTETYNVDNSNGTYRLNAQGKPEKTGVVGTGRLSKAVTVSYGTEQVKSVTVVTHVDVERTQRTLALKKPVVFIEGASLEYNVQDVLDVKNNGTSESLSGYVVKSGSPFRIEANKLKYIGTFGDAATLTLVKNGAEVSTSVNTYRLPTFSTVDDITTSDHVRKKITVPNPTGPVMSLPGIVTETTFVQSTSDIYVEATGNTADVFGMSAITGTLTITQTVYYNTTLLTQDVQTVNVTVTSNEVHATGITLNSTFPFINGKIVMFNVTDNDTLNNIPISSLATLTGPSNMTSKLKARLLGTNEGFVIEDDKLKLTANRKSVNRIQLYSSDDESIAKEVELLLYPLPLLSVRPTDISGRVGDAAQNINSGLQDASQYNDVVGFSHDITYSTTSNSFTVETPGVIRFVSAGTGTATVELDAKLDGKIFYKTYANVNVTVTANEVQDTRRLVLKGAALNNPMVVFNDNYDEEGEDNGFYGYNDGKPISELVSIEGGTGTIKIKENALNATIKGGNLFDIPDDLTEDKLAPVEFYIDGTDISKTVNVQYYAHPQPTVSIPTTNQFTIGDKPMQLEINFDDAACVSDSRFRKEVEWSVEGGIGTISDSGLFTPTTAGGGSIRAHVKCIFDGVKILDLEIRGRFITVKDKYELIIPNTSNNNSDLDHSDGRYTIYNKINTSKRFYGIKSTKNGQPIMPNKFLLCIRDHLPQTVFDGNIHTPYVDVNCTQNSDNTFDLTITTSSELQLGETLLGYVTLINGNTEEIIIFKLQEFITDIYAVPTQVPMDKTKRSAYFDVFVDGVHSKYGYSYSQSDYDITYNDQNGNWSVVGSTDGEVERSGYNRITVEQHNDVENTGIDIVVRSRHNSSKTITVPVRYTAGQSGSTTTTTPTPSTPPLSDDVTYVDEAADEQFEIGDHVKLTAREYPSATYSWHLPDGSTRTERELNFVAATDNAGMYVAYIFRPGSNQVIRQNINVSFFSVQETAVSEADKQVHVGDSIEFTAPTAIGMLYSSDGGTQVDDEYPNYQWQITSTPDVDSSWTSISGGDKQNLTYVASQEGVYYIRRTVTMGNATASGGKTKVTVSSAVQGAPKRISNVTVNSHNLVNIQAGTPTTVNYTVTYNGELEDGNTNDVNIVPSNAETSYAIGDDNVTIDDVYITVDKTNKTITFETERKLGAKEVELEVLSNSNVVGMFTVNVTPQTTPSPTSTQTPAAAAYEEHGELVNPHGNSDGTPTPTPTTPVSDSNNTPKTTVDPSVTPTPTAGPVL